MRARRVTAVIGLLFAMMLGAVSPASAITTPTPRVSPTSIPPTDSPTATPTRIPPSPTPLPTLTNTRRPNTATPTDAPPTETMTPRATNTLGASSGIAETASAIAAQSTVGPTRTPSAVGSGEATERPSSDMTRTTPTSDPSATRQTPTIDASRTLSATNTTSAPDATRTPAVVPVFEDEQGNGGAQTLLVALLIAAGLAIIGVSQATRRPK